MKRIMGISLLAIAAACAPVAPVEMTALQQSNLTQALAGRTAGPAVNCVSQRNLRGNRSFGEGAILFEGTGGTVYVNRPPAGCPNLNFGRALVFRTSGAQLCSGDIASVLDTGSGFAAGSCSLGEFTPYRRDR